MNGDDYIARDFWLVLRGFPKRLALPCFPAGRGSIQRRERTLRQRAAPDEEQEQTEIDLSPPAIGDAWDQFPPAAARVGSVCLPSGVM